MIVTEAGHTWIKFKNGYTVSIFNGFGSYTDNHFNYKIRESRTIESKTCEVAILKDEIFVTENLYPGRGEVLEEITPEELVDIICKTKAL